MPSDLVAALRAPLLALQAMVGDGRLGEDPAGQLRVVGQRLAELAAVGAGATARIGADWAGRGFDAAHQFFAPAFSAIDDIGARSVSLAGRVSAAADAVSTAHADLQRILDDFTATATALEPGLPATADALVAAARQALDDAIAVVTRLEDELEEHTAAVGPPAAAAPTSSGVAPPPFPAFGGAVPQGLGIGGPGAVSPPFGAMTGGGDQAPQHLFGAAAFGDGVAIRLPDGSTAMAPNAVAADAVRNALSQVGVPYQWGGTTPGVGLDCSGLTQWAYREAGLELPRIAEQQDVGAAVSADSLLPGDLAVWDGHVAMVVGNGMMVEAGDPVQVSPIRTTNIGQGFQGFWRPTA